MENMKKLSQPQITCSQGVPEVNSRERLYEIV